MRKEKALANIIDELYKYPCDSTVEPIDGGALVIHLPDGSLAEVITFSHVDDPA